MSTALRKTHKIAAVAVSVWLMAGLVRAEGERASEEPETGRWIMFGANRSWNGRPRDYTVFSQSRKSLFAGSTCSWSHA